MISFDKTAFYYAGAKEPSLADVTMEIPDGSFVLVTGKSGSGKTTLLRSLNGLIPHFYGGKFGGSVNVYGADTRTASVRTLSAAVGFVFQDSTAQFVTSEVTGEIAFGLENIGLPQADIVRRVEETAAFLGITHLLGRQAATLSGGEKQKVAIASVLAMRPEAIALDEPTAELDPASAEELLELLIRLNKDHGLTVILAEHRLERVFQFADKIIEMRRGEAEAGTVREMAEKIENVPPVVELGRALNWKPLPVSVKEARECLNDEIAASLSEDAPRNDAIAVGPDPIVAVCVKGVSFSYGNKDVLTELDLSIYAGQVTALMGRNGAGKTTLLKLICGLIKPAKGRVTIDEMDTAIAEAGEVFKRVGYVPQRPGALLFADTVEEEIVGITRSKASLQGKDKGSGPKPVEKGPDPRSLIREFGLDGHAEDYPRDLSQGEQQRVALAAILVEDPPVILFDEPTHGLDYGAKLALADRLCGLAAGGKAVVVATHDVETVARTANRIVFLDDRIIAAEGNPKEVMPGIPILRTQMNEVFGGDILTVEDAIKEVRSTKSTRSE